MAHSGVPENVADTVRRAASHHADALALVSADETSVDAGLTWAELDARVDAVATALRRLELTASGGAPARVAIALPQVPAFAEAFFGTLRAGLVAVPINPAYTARELRHVLADSGAELMVTTGDAAAAVESVRADLPVLAHVYTVDSDGPGTRPYAELTAPASPVTAVGRGRGPRRTALHLRHSRRTQGRHALPPRACSPTRARWRRSTHRS